MKHALLFAACLTAGPASAEFLSGNNLLELLRSQERHERAAADGYIMGVHDTARGVVHCSPNTVTLSQVRDLSAQFITAAAASRHKSADSLVLAILQEAFPCPKRQSRGGDV
jgi:hypothetical protein